MEIEKDNIIRKIALINTTKAMGDLSVAYGTLMYVDKKIGDKSLVIMLDTNATHTFVVSKIVQTYGMKVSTFMKRIKL